MSHYVEAAIGFIGVVSIAAIYGESQPPERVMFLLGMFTAAGIYGSFCAMVRLVDE